MKTLRIRQFLYSFTPVFLYAISVDLKLLPNFDLLILVIIFLGIFIGKVLANVVLDWAKAYKITHTVFLIIHLISLLGLVSMALLDSNKIIDMPINYTVLFLAVVVGLSIKWNLPFIFSSENYNNIMSLEQ